MAKPVLIEVSWDDAHADFLEATQDDLADFHHPLVMRTTGWLLRDDDLGITLANERCDHDQTFRGRTFIPRQLVRGVAKLGRPGRKRKTQADQPSSSDSGGSDGDGHLLAPEKPLEPLA